MVLPPRWGNNTVCVWSSLQQFLFLVFFPSHWVIQLWGFPFFLYFYFFHTLLFRVLRLYFNFLEIIWLDTKKKKKTSGRDFCFPYSSSLLAQNILIGCRTFVSQIPTTPPLTPSEPRISPSRKFFVLLMRSCSCWAQLCQSHQHPRQACTLYAVCVWGRWYSWSVQEELWKASLLNLCHMLNHQTCLFIFKKRSLH